MVKITVLHNELECFENSQSGFSLLIENEGAKILMDTSHSNEFIENAKKKKINLNDLNFLVLSHGHWDHTNGIKFLTNIDLTVVAHPNCFEKKQRDARYIGAPFTLEEAKSHFIVKLYKHTTEFTKNVFFLGEIPRTNAFEAKKPVGRREGGDDFVIDDSALAIKTNKGLAVVTGCGHSGICNTIEYAKRITKQNKISVVIGGFHLFDKEQTDKTISYFKRYVKGGIYPLHCLDDYAFHEFEKIGAKRLRTLGTIEL